MRKRDFPQSVCEWARQYWLTAFEEQEKRPFEFDSRDHSALISILQKIGWKRETAKGKERAFTSEERLGINARNETLKPRIKATFDAYLADGWYAGHPITRLKTDVDKFISAGADALAGRQPTNYKINPRSSYGNQKPIRAERIYM